MYWLVINGASFAGAWNQTDCTCKGNLLLQITKPGNELYCVDMSLYLWQIECYLIYRKSSIKPPQGVLFISNTFEEGLNRDRGLIWEGAGVFNLAKMLASVLHKALQYKVEFKLKYKKLEVMPAEDQKQIRTSSWWINHPWSVHTKFYGRDWLLQSIIY